MDLAEIRKRAQKEQKEQKGNNEFVDRPAVISEESNQQTVELPQATADPLADLIEESYPADTEPRPGKAVEAVAADFDPLAVLIAGREASSEGLEAPEDAGTMAVSTGEEFQEFLCFRVSSEIYAINILAIKEIIRPREVTEIPRTPGFVSGVLSLRGIIIPVFNMRLRLGLPEGDASGKERIIVVKKGEEFIGIVVDEVTQVVKIAAATIERPPEVLDGIDRDFVSGIGRFNSQMLILLNQEKILDISLG
jgi:purine-binding chemotaxis protein CheW